MKTLIAKVIMSPNQSQKNNLKEWQYKELGELLEYEQPTDYIVDSEDYRNEYQTPVLTAGKTFVLGYTDENFGIYNNLPVIIFDDFTTAHKFVDFPFKVKSSAMKILRAKKSVNIKFIYGWMQSHPYTVGEHKRTYLSEYQYQDILLPPLPEQNRIVVILETWDKTIEKLNKKITIKKQIKKGLMQDLLTGKKRLKGFDDKWKIVKLKEICNIQKGEQLNKDNMIENGIYDALNGGIEASGRTNKWNTEADTITISEGGNSCGFVNFNYKRFWCGGHCYAINPHKNIDNLFLYQVLKNKQRKIMTLRIGSGLPNIQKKSLDNLKINLPSNEEQKTIAEIFTTADQEITKLENKLSIIKDQKKYLLNNLITGAVRTPENLKVS